MDYIKIIEPNYEEKIGSQTKKNKHYVCGDLEMLLRIKHRFENKNNLAGKNITIYIMSPEENYIWTLLQ